ncbi:hypothetical protein DBR44_16235 [Aquitalea sp. FJL05]|nr:hypothetical protein DBR44_16235 [Aquitalea sp. FJL05]
MKLCIALALISFSSVAMASGSHSSGYSSHSSPSAYGSTGSHSVSGYTRQDGTYVAPHMQTNPNSTKNDNWSTRGNVNPYTGVYGSKPGDDE